MKMEEILAIMKSLARSQGFYGRLLNYLNEIKQNNADHYDALVKKLEAQNFKTPLDVVMYIEQ
ncbi:MAG: hypothetical protein EOM77_05290 [Bacteroidia bacterium]|nr:hypothetical protein [Bacteroidia bacterium]